MNKHSSNFLNFSENKFSLMQFIVTTYVSSEQVILPCPVCAVCTVCTVIQNIIHMKIQMRFVTCKKLIKVISYIPLREFQRWKQFTFLGMQFLQDPEAVTFHKSFQQRFSTSFLSTYFALVDANKQNWLECTAKYPNHLCIYSFSVLNRRCNQNRFLNEYNFTQMCSVNFLNFILNRVLPMTTKLRMKTTYLE